MAASEQRWVPSRLWLGWLGVVGFCIRVHAAATIGRENPTWGDGYWYHAQANALASGHWFIDPFLQATTGRIAPGNAHPPLYSLWLGIASFLGGTSFAAHKVMSCLAGLLLVVVIGLLAEEVAGRRAGLAAGFLAAIYPPFWVVSSLLMSEELFAALVAWFLLLVYRWHRRPSRGRAIWCGIALACAALTRPEAILFSVVLVAPVMLYPGRGSYPGEARRRPAWAALAWAGGACVLLVAPWVVRNALVFDRFQPLSSNGDLVQAYTNNPVAYGTLDEEVACGHPPRPITVVLQPSGNDLLGYWSDPWVQYLRCEQGDPTGDSSDVAAYWEHVGLQYATRHRGRVPVVLAARVGRIWGAYRWQQEPLLSSIEGRPIWVSRLGWWCYWALLELALVGLVVLRRRRVLIWPLLSTGVVVTAVAMYAYGGVRFRLPLDVAIVVGAAVAIDAAMGSGVSLLRRVRRAQRGEQAARTAAATPSASSPCSASSASALP